MIETLDAAARRAHDEPALALDALPWLGAAIEADASAGRLGTWGRSTVVDEHVGGPVIGEALFAALHERAGLRERWPVGNAALLHVYGYLLSTVPTPFGLKRDRWLDGSLARAYGLADDAFVPWSSERTLLERVDGAARALLARGATRSSAVGGVEASVALGREPDTGPWALAYAVDGRLITTFPVVSAVELLAEWDAEPPRLRWNAVR